MQGVLIKRSAADFSLAIDKSSTQPVIVDERSACPENTFSFFSRPKCE
jgi:hypothetical protein